VFGAITQKYKKNNPQMAFEYSSMEVHRIGFFVQCTPLPLFRTDFEVTDHLLNRRKELKNAMPDTAFGRRQQSGREFHKSVKCLVL
jgi:hypothetical protein